MTAASDTAGVGDIVAAIEDSSGRCGPWSRGRPTVDGVQCRFIYTGSLAGRPKLGQHFLEDDSILARIAELAAPSGDELVVEIGPGRGALTKHLLARSKRVVAVELDRNLAAALLTRCKDSDGLEVIQADVLAVDLSQLIGGRGAQRITVVGNLPYYITSPILRKVFDARAACANCVFLIQEEVADRLVAGPGSRDYGYLSCLTQLCGAPHKQFVVPAEAFRPPPRVSSAVVSIAISGAAPPEELLGFLSDCFRAPRKMLRNNLSGRFLSRELTADPDGKLRAQQMSLEELTAMWRRLTGGQG